MSSHTEDTQAQLRKAVQLAIEGKWDEAHNIVQEYDENPLASRIHAILHKIEGDIANAKYWYRKAGVAYTSADPQQELLEVFEQHSKR